MQVKSPSRHSLVLYLHKQCESCVQLFSDKLGKQKELSDFAREMIVGSVHSLRCISRRAAVA